MVIFFFFNDTATTEIYTLSLHDALPICRDGAGRAGRARLVRRAFRRSSTLQGGRRLMGSYEPTRGTSSRGRRSEEHTSELQSPCNLVCRLLLEKKKQYTSDRTPAAPPIH